MFLDSTNLKVFPTSYRGTEVNDLNAGFMSEENLTYLKRLSENNKLNNYFKCDTSVTDKYTFDLTLYGYRFVFTLDLTDAAFQSGGSLAPAANYSLYAIIKPTQNTITENETETFQTLTPVSGTNEGLISILDDENDKFEGLEIIKSATAPSIDYIYQELFHCEGNSWVLSNTHSNLKIQSNEISNDVNGTKNITEEFDATVINLDNTNGHIIKNGQYAEVPNHNQIGVNYNGYVLSLDSNNELIWRAPYDGSLS